MNPNPNFDDYEDLEDAKTALFSGFVEPSSPKAKTVQIAPAPTGDGLLPLWKVTELKRVGSARG